MRRAMPAAMVSRVAMMAGVTFFFAYVDFHPAEVLPIIKSVARHPLFKALEIAEFNPHKDKKHKTRDLIGKIIESAFAKSASGD